MRLLFVCGWVVWSTFSPQCQGIAEIIEKYGGMVRVGGCGEIESENRLGASRSL